MKRATLLILLVLLSFRITAQFTQFWNTSAMMNPALLALDYKQAGYALTDFSSFQKFNGKYYGNFNNNLANYAVYLDKINSGLGIIVNAYWGYSVSNVKLAYNYQVKIKNSLALVFGGSFGPMNLGGGMGFGHSYWQGDLGFSIKSERFRLGVGKQNLGKLLYLTNIDDLFSRKVSSVYAEYRFGNADGFQFIPRIMGTKTTGDLALYSQGQLGFKNTYFFGFGAVISDGSTNVLMVNLEYVLAKKIKFSYTLNRNRSSDYNTYNKYYYGFNHEFGVGVQFGNRNIKKPEQQ
jgi:hypothetical protein